MPCVFGSLSEFQVGEHDTRQENVDERSASGKS